MPVPLAYHITFGTYGARLHGDARGTVDRRHNTPGEPVLGPDPRRRRRERELCRLPPILLNDAQRRFVETVIPELCARGGWGYHIAAAGRDHVHVLLSADALGNQVRALLKRWLGQALAARWPLPARGRWWAEGGSVKWIWDQHYFRRSFDYVAEQRFTRE